MIWLTKGILFLMQQIFFQAAYDYFKVKYVDDPEKFKDLKAELQNETESIKLTLQEIWGNASGDISQGIRDIQEFFVSHLQKHYDANSREDLLKCFNKAKDDYKEMWDEMLNSWDQVKQSLTSFFK